MCFCFLFVFLILESKFKATLCRTFAAGNKIKQFYELLVEDSLQREDVENMSRWAQILFQSSSSRFPQQVREGYRAAEVKSQLEAIGLKGEDCLAVVLLPDLVLFSWEHRIRN